MRTILSGSLSLNYASLLTCGEENSSAFSISGLRGAILGAFWKEGCIAELAHLS